VAENKARIRAAEQVWRDANRDRLVAIRARRKDKAQAYMAEWREDNREHTRATARAHYHANRDKRLVQQKIYRQEAKALRAEHQARRRAVCKQAASLNVEPEKVAAFYVEAQRRTLETGVTHEVDHIVPLKGRNVCGLHVWWNLQVLTADDNRRKKDSYADES
jgi:5-methylcytosine-specific restriction endonuclease McrA